MVDIVLNMGVNFALKEGESQTVVSAATGDTLLIVTTIIALVSLVILAFALAKKSVYAGIVNSKIKHTNNFVLKLIFIFLTIIFIVLTGTIISNSVSEAMASTDIICPSSINAYVDKDTGEVEFDQATLKNISGQKITIKEAQVKLDDSLKSVPSLADAEVTIEGFNGVFYDETPDTYAYREDDPALSYLKTSEDTTLKLSMSNIDQQDIVKVDGKQVFTIVMSVAEATIQSVDSVTFDYDGKMHKCRDNYEYFSNIEGDNEAIDADVYTCTYNLRPGYIWDNQTVTPQTVSWNINKANLYVTTPTDEKFYDGKALSLPPTVEGFVNDEDAPYKSATTITDATTSPVTNNYEIEWDDESATAKEKNYEIIEELGTLNILPRPISLTSGSSQKLWDGSPLTNNYVEEGPMGWADGEGATYNVTGVATQVGKFENTFSVIFNSGTKENNYDVETHFGTLWIYESIIDIHIEGAKSTVRYDDQEHSISGYNATSDYSDFDPLKITPIPDECVVTGKNEGIYNMNLSWKKWDYADDRVFPNFIFDSDGKLTITSLYLDIRIYGNNATYEYNGSPYSLSGYRAEASGTTSLFDQTKISPSKEDFVIEGTNAGTYTMNLKDPSITWEYLNDSVAVTFVVESNGQLTINPQKVPVPSCVSSHTYTGEAQSHVIVPEGETRYSVSGNEQTDAGENYQTVASLNDTNNYIWDPAQSAEDQIFNWSISKASLSVQTYSDTKMYDGTALVPGGAITGLVHLETAILITKQNAIDVCSAIDNTYTITWVSAKESNYIVSSETLGKITITKRGVTLTSGTSEKTYDGSPLTNNEISVTGDGWVVGEGANYNFTGSITDAGSADNTFSYTLFDNTKEVNYNINCGYGTLTVNPASVALPTIATNLKYQGVSQIGIIIPEGEERYSVTNKTKTDAGEYTSVASLVSKNNYYWDGKGTSDDQTLDWSIGPAVLSVTTQGASKTFDGTPLTNTDCTVTGWVNEESATAVGTGSITNFGSTQNTYSIKWAESISAKETNYTVGYQNLGTLNINKRIVVLTSGTSSRAFDGTALTNDSVTVTGDGWVSSDDATYNVTGTQTYVGSSENTFSYVLKAGLLPTNYSVSVSYGTLTINAAEITIPSVTDSFEYSGLECVAISVPVGENRYTVTNGSGTDAGFYSATISLTDKQNCVWANGGGTDDKVRNWRITAALLNITTSTTTKTYDGSPIDSSGSINGWKNNESAPFSTSSLTDAGSITNYYYIDWNNESSTAKPNNYVIGTQNLGTLTVAKRNITLTSASDSKIYDKMPLTNSSVGVSGTWAPGEGATYTVTGTITNFGSIENTFSYTLFDNTKADNYNITVAPGTLTITKRPLTISVFGNTKCEIADGSQKTVEGWDSTCVELEYFDKNKVKTNHEPSSYKITATEPGDYYMNIDVNTFYYDDTNFAPSFSRFNDGYLRLVSVADLVIKIEGPIQAYTYDGNKKSISGYTATKTSGTHDFDPSKITPAPSNFYVEATDAGIYKMNLWEQTFSYDTEGELLAIVFDVQAEGLLRINPIEVDVPTAEDLTYNTQTQTGVKVDATDPYTVTNNTATAAGSYVATASLKDKTNYAWNLETKTSQDQNINWSIAKKKISNVEWSIPSGGFTYNKTVQAPTCTTTDFFAGEDASLEIGPLSPTYDLISAKQQKATISYIKGEGASNYELNLGEDKLIYTYTIAKKTLTISWSVPAEGLIYDGTVKSPTFFATNVLTGDICNINTYIETDGKYAGTQQKITLTSIAGYGADNYELPGQKTYTYAIQPKEVDILWNIPGGSFVYDGNEHYPEANASGLVGSDSVAVKTVLRDGGKAVNAGHYIIEAWSLTGDKSANYKIKDNSKYEYNIGKVKPSFSMVDFPGEINLGEGESLTYSYNYNGTEDLIIECSGAPAGIMSVDHNKVDKTITFNGLRIADGLTVTISSVASQNVESITPVSYNAKVIEKKYNVNFVSSEKSTVDGLINGEEKVELTEIPRNTSWEVSGNTVTLTYPDGTTFHAVASVDPAQIHHVFDKWEESSSGLIEGDTNFHAIFCGALYSYTLDELKSISSDLSEKGGASDYYDEFKTYVDRGFYRNNNGQCTGEDNGVSITNNINKINHWAIDANGKTFTEDGFVDNDSTIQVRIIGINEDTVTGGGTAGLTFMATHLYGPGVPFRTNGISDGGWAGDPNEEAPIAESKLRSTMSSLSLPQNLSDSLKTVTKKYGMYYNQEALGTCQDKVFALAFSEIVDGTWGRTPTYPYKQEGNQYSAFKDKITSKYDEQNYYINCLKNITKTQTGTSTYYYACLRSLYDGSNQYILVFNNSDNGIGVPMMVGYGYSPLMCFCL